jgi:hypothetical protein
VAPRVLGKTFAGPEEIHPALDLNFRGNQMAKAAVEMAAWELAARREGVSLARKLGGTRDRIQVGISLGIQKDPQTHEYKIALTSVTGSGDGPYAGDMTLQVAPSIGKAQEVILLLNQVQSQTGEPAAYRFTARPRDPKTAPPADASITIPIQGVAKGTYLLRIPVDGAESPLDFAGDQYTGPLVTIP